MSSNHLNQNIIDEIIETDRSDETDVRAATDSYQAEFPYERDGEVQVTRREFCNFLFLTSTALMVGAAGFAGVSAIEAQNEPKYEGLKIEGAENLEVGAALNFRYPTATDTAILIRARDGEYYAFDQKCTHLSCPVYYAKEHDRLECPCHEGGFDVKTGKNTYGPPPRPLPRIMLEKRAGGEIWAVGVIYGGEYAAANIATNCKRERRA
jgi:nitrite reductase/ring-hydroxylating ferredoxin subunit